MRNRNLLNKPKFVYIFKIIFEKIEIFKRSQFKIPSHNTLQQSVLNKLKIKFMKTTSAIFIMRSIFKGKFRLS